MRHGQGQREGRLERRLVPARKNAPRVSRLRVACEHPLAAVVDAIVHGIEAARGLVVDRRGVGDPQLVTPGRDRSRKRECHRLLVLVHRGGFRGRNVIDRRPRERQVDGIEHKALGRLAHLDIDDGQSLGCECRQVGLQIDGVVDRDHGLRQLAGRRFERKRPIGVRRRHEQQQHENAGQRPDEAIE